MHDKHSFKAAKTFIYTNICKWPEYAQAWGTFYGPINYSDAKWQKVTGLMDIWPILCLTTFLITSARSWRQRIWEWRRHEGLSASDLPAGTQWFPTQAWWDSYMLRAIPACKQDILRSEIMDALECPGLFVGYSHTMWVFGDFVLLK